MTSFSLHTIESAPAGSKPLLQVIQRKYGFIPNLLAELAESPAALKAAMALDEAYGTSSLTPVEQQAVLLGLIGPEGGSMTNAWRMLRLALPKEYRVHVRHVSHSEMAASGAWYVVSQRLGFTDGHVGRVSLKPGTPGVTDFFCMNDQCIRKLRGKWVSGLAVNRPAAYTGIYAYMDHAEPASVYGITH